ncbi:uncharacterized protein LOC130673306 [Microplitis mediator]|uniref:uncharacterized protein LOC130673306 n=1 Tax=Microplitis mediator TaxID=375433 RepID=UPI002555AE70|nr:uncharacterized protein LOC130673306 [Microplitis mediator]
MYVMMKLIAIFVVLLHAEDLIDACSSHAPESAIDHLRTVSAPPKPFLIDEQTPVYFLKKRTFVRKTLGFLNSRNKINYVKFHKDDSDIEPYTLFLKTIVIVDDNMFTFQYGTLIFDRIMSFMSNVESSANNIALYPKIKLVVTAIIAAVHPQALPFLEPHDNILNPYSNPNPLNFTQQWLSSNSKVLRDGMKADFVLVISGADYANPGWELLFDFGTFNCTSEESSKNTPPIVIVADKVPFNDYAQVYYQFMSLIDPHLKNWPCDRAFLHHDYESDFCEIHSLRRNFSTTFPSCLYSKPAFLN